MRRLICLFLLASACACGPDYIAAPSPAPEWETCETVERSLVGHTVSTPVPIPFTGPRSFVLWTGKPDGWDEFEGSVHLREVTWDVDWISNGSIQIGGLTVAELDRGRWFANAAVDIRPAIHAEGEFLKFEAKIRGSGVKPAGKQTLTTQATIAFCGIGQATVAAGFRAVVRWGVD